jgi:outer membrane protein assembly factor BamB
MKRRTLIIIFTILVAGICSGIVNADDYDWPRWRGPNGDGISNETDWDPEALNGGPKILWKTNVGMGHSNIAIQGKYLYTMGNDFKEDTVYCFNAETGENIWQYSYKCPKGSYGTQSTPFVDGRFIYTLSYDGQLFCFNAKKGNIRWKKNIVKEFQAIKPDYGFATSPVIEGKLLILNTHTHGMALDKKSGELVWTSEPAAKDAEQYSTPVVYDHDGKRYTAIFGQRKGNIEGNCLYSVEVETGKVFWFHERWNTAIVVDPILFENNVIISNGFSGSGFVLLETTKSLVKPLWENMDVMSEFSTGVLVDGYLYSNNDYAPKGELICLDIKTGKVMWKKELGAVSLIAANSKLIIIEERGNLYIAEAAPSSYQEISRCKIANQKGKELWWTSPVLCGSMIYCRNNMGDIVCIDVRK